MDFTHRNYNRARVFIAFLQPPPRRMVIQNYLSILRCGYFDASAIITRFTFGVNIDNFAIAFILKQQSLCAVSNNLWEGERERDIHHRISQESMWTRRGRSNLIMRGRIWSRQLSFPIIIAEVGGFRKQLFSKSYNSSMSVIVKSQYIIKAYWRSNMGTKSWVRSLW
jgi:hypothetical protein